MNWCFLTDFIDSSGRNRTYNPSVKSRQICRLSVAISSYPLCTLPTPSFPPIATYTPQIMPYFEVVWAQKWVQFNTTHHHHNNHRERSCPRYPKNLIVVRVDQDLVAIRPFVNDTRTKMADRTDSGAM